MKPEEQVRAGFEAWHTKEFGSCDWHNANHANRWIGYQAAYAQARREALEEAAKVALVTLQSLTTEMEGYSYCGSNPGVPADEYDEVAKAIRALIKD